MALNMDQEFRRTCRGQRDRAAILTHKVSWTYGELDEEIERAAACLRTAGLKPGQSVGLHLASGVDYIVGSYAVWRCGACLVPIAPELSEPEKSEVIEAIAMDFVISGKKPQPWLEAVTAGAATALSPKVSVFPAASGARHPPEFASVNAAFVRFTSGTTGQSKGVVLSHETINERIHAANEALQLNPEDRVMWLLSMSYHFTVSIVGYLTFGCAIILPRNTLAGAVLEACEKFEATFLYGSPMHCTLLADFPGEKRLPSLRKVIATTAAMRPEVGEHFFERFGVPISQALGIIEVGLPAINLAFAEKKPSSVGQVLPAYEMRLKDAGFGDGLLEIEFRGPGFLDAYYSPWRSRDMITDDGWFATHDVGDLDEDGCLYIRARSKDVISVAGMKFFPQEVERVLLSDERVAEAAVFSVPHTRMGHVPKARVVVHAGVNTEGLEDELRSICQKRLAQHKVPESIEFLAELPRTASGKVLHRA